MTTSNYVSGTEYGKADLLEYLVSTLIAHVYLLIISEEDLATLKANAVALRKVTI
ncbi:MAG: hypothetical protein RLZ75_1040 [Pseudomonadota bacterium]|jgi:hypothetical protein